MAADIGIRATLNLSYEQAVQKTTDALKAEGFGVLTQIDVKATQRRPPTDKVHSHNPKAAQHGEYSHEHPQPFSH